MKFVRLHKTTMLYPILNNIFYKYKTYYPIPCTSFHFLYMAANTKDLLLGKGKDLAVIFSPANSRCLMLTSNPLLANVVGWKCLILPGFAIGKNSLAFVIAIRDAVVKELALVSEPEARRTRNSHFCTSKCWIC